MSIVVHARKVMEVSTIEFIRFFIRDLKTFNCHCQANTAKNRTFVHPRHVVMEPRANLCPAEILSVSARKASKERHVQKI